MRELAQQDPEVHATILAEFRRQQDDLELIASENYVSLPVLQALGTVLTNKYAEGLPGKRYYGGCEYVDTVEELARSRAKQLFGAVGANVQPHAGAQANAAVYLAVCKPGDTVLGLDLTHGGHLTHGSPVNSSGMLYNAVHYRLDEATGRLDMDAVRDLARQHRPRMIVTGASAYARTIDFAAFRSIADEVGAILMADIAHIAGLVVTGHHPSPVPHCEFVTTTTHKTLRGPRGGLIMANREWAPAMNKAVFPGTQGGPLEHVIAAKAVAFGEALRPDFKTYIGHVVENARVMAETLMERGLGLVSGGTDNHLMLVDLGERCSGKEAEEALGRARITVNKNTVPGEKRSPMVTSGIRIGTPAMTTRGLRRDDAVLVAHWIADAIEGREDAAVLERIAGQVHELCGRFPVYPDDLYA
ncbi:MAG: serine hydroxymethyltransferase [Alphaproteobacteria bacterium]|nr:serine hydroxymethyltransferase [Alphaproteobacteria bacterium]MCB9699713.1 serine hydroxymethyltransferase [Alphaproteobacteria bacterium]